MRSVQLFRLSLLLLSLCAADGRKPDFRWNMEVIPPTLSTHQRLMMHVIVHVDGRDLEKRRGAGDFNAFVELRDAQGRPWQNRASINLKTMQPGMQARDLEVSMYAFVLPGDYMLSVAVFDSATEERSVKTHKLHVAPLKSDPLPSAWAGLPPVEFIQAPDGQPDVWFLPDVKGKLNLSVSTRRPVHVELLVNTTPSERAAGSVAALRRNMSLLIPALKIFSDMRLEGGTIDAALLDLTRRKIAYEQRDVHELNWVSLRRFFLESNPGVIDVHALENESKMREYFAEEIARRLAAPDDRAIVIIVLSGPAFFGNQADFGLQIGAETPDRKLIYIRDRFVGAGRRPPPRPGARLAPPRPLNTVLPVDDLEHALEPLHAHIYDAANGDQFRRVLAAVMNQISAM